MVVRTDTIHHPTLGRLGCIRQRITYAVENTVIDLGAMPAYATIMFGGVHIKTAFDDSGTDTLDVGFRGGSATDDPDAYATALVIDAVGFIPLDVLHTTANIINTSPVIVTCRYNGENNNATAGVAYVSVVFSVGPTGGE